MPAAGWILRVGPYLLCRPIPGPAYCRAFLAREIATGRTVRLSVAHLPEHQIGDGYRRLAALLAASRTIDHPTIAPIASVGVAEGQLWAASRHDPGTTAAESLTHHGRLPPAPSSRLRGKWYPVWRSWSGPDSAMAI